MRTLSLIAESGQVIWKVEVWKVTFPVQVSVSPSHPRTRLPHLFCPCSILFLLGYGYPKDVKDPLPPVLSLHFSFSLIKGRGRIGNEKR